MTAQLKSGIHSFAAAKCEQFSTLNLPSPLYRSLSSVLMVTSGGGSFLSSLTGNFHIFSLACVVVVIKQMPLLNAVCRQENALKRIKSMSSLHPSYSNTALRIFMGLKS